MTQITSLQEEDFQGFATDPAAWLAKEAQARTLTHLLAHADDGVIWGHVQDNKLVTSGKVFDEVKVDLRSATLQQVRLFSPNGELLIWRSGTAFNGRFLADDPDDEIIAETQLLWGEASDPPGPQNGFTLMRDGRQGLLHAPPIVLRRGERAALKVHHYIQNDPQGQAYIAFSRLVEVVTA